jgi:hypothetical protein
LETINLMGTKITDEGLANLASPPALRTLYLELSHVSEEGVSKFRDLHPHCEVHGPRY